MSSLLWKKSAIPLNQLQKVADLVKSSIKTPAVILLTGPLGAGKTTFSKLFCQHEGVFTSPTYDILQQAGKILHGDFYRLESEEELLYLELGAQVEEKEYVLIEWGKEYLDALRLEIPTRFSYYEIVISNDETSPSLRRFELFQI